MSAGVLIDPDDAAQLKRFWDAWDDLEDTGPLPEHPMTMRELRLRAALRSLIGLPKPDQPQNRYAVVVDIDGVEWIRDRIGHWGNSSTDGKTYAGWRTRSWADIAAVRVLSEGIA